MDVSNTFVRGQDGQKFYKYGILYKVKRKTIRLEVIHMGLDAKTGT